MGGSAASGDTQAAAPRRDRPTAINADVLSSEASELRVFAKQSRGEKTPPCSCSKVGSRQPHRVCVCGVVCSLLGPNEDPRRPPRLCDACLCAQKAWQKQPQCFCAAASPRQAFFVRSTRIDWLGSPPRFLQSMCAQAGGAQQKGVTRGKMDGVELKCARVQDGSSVIQVSGQNTG